MRQNRTKRRLVSMVLCVFMAVSMMSGPVLAEEGMFAAGTVGEVAAFEALGPDIASRSVPLGTPERDLELPGTLSVTIRIADLDEPAPAPEETDAKSVGAATGIDDAGGTEAGAGSEAAFSPDEEIDGDEAGLAGETASGTGEIAVSLPVTWVSSPEYDGDAAGTYVFNPVLPQGLVPAVGVETPAIIVTVVSAATAAGKVTAFDELPGDIRWQNTTEPVFPETVCGTVEGEKVQIPVTWTADHYFDEKQPQRGLYVFTAVLGEGFWADYGAELPRITVFIPQTAGRMAARMAGGGTAESPLEITSAVQLAEIAGLVNARKNGLELFLFNDAGARVSLKLINDIDLSAYAGNGGWVPIGTDTCPFGGEFDGSGFQITGLRINREKAYQGLFGYVDGGTVMNVGVTDVNIIGGSFTGGITGHLKGTIQNSYSTGTVTVNTTGSFVGGVAGYVNSGTVQNCYSAVSVTGLYAGGIVGSMQSGTVQNCYSTGSVTGTGDCIGGIVGYMLYGTVQNCYSIGSVSGTGSNVGGVVGEVYDSSVLNCAAMNLSVAGTGSVGRVAGRFQGGVLSGNIAFDGMPVTVGGSAKTLIEGADQVDGESKTAAGIKAAGFFQTLFADSVWVYTNGRLPVLKNLPGQTDTLPVHISGSPFEGSGTSADPYRIYTAADLAMFAELVNAGTSPYANSGVHYSLQNDIDLSAYGADYDGGKGWIPIGKEYERFSGVLDGKGHRVTGLYINRAEDFQGLFGFVAGGTVSNLIVTGADVTGSYYTGIVSGYISNGRIQSCYSTGSVNSEDSFVGGLVGRVENSSIIQSCFSNAVVSGGSFSGGVVGCMSGSSAATVRYCYSTGSVTGSGYGNTGNYVGGVVGRIIIGNVQNCAALNSSVVGRSSVGRVVGRIDNGTISNNIAFNGITVTQNGVAKTIVEGAGQLDGASKTANEIKSAGFFEALFENDPAWIYPPGRLPILKDLPGQSGMFPGYIGNVAGDLTGAGTSENPYRIYTAADLAKLEELVNKGIAPYANADVYYRLESDIDLSDYGVDYDGGKGWNPIGANSEKAFNGIFNGNNKTITGLTINRPGNDRIGLFGYILSSGRVHNTTIMGASITGENYVGGIAGYTWNSIENCAVYGYVSGTDYVGGIAGCVYGGAVQNSIAGVTVSGANYVGGLTGSINGTIQDCHTTGIVSGESNVGGIAGKLNGTMQNCLAGGIVQGNQHIGGVLGKLIGGTVRNCVALNPSIETGVSDFGRVAGSVETGALVSNYAFSRISGSWWNRGLGRKDGADATVQVLFSVSFWSDADNWDTAPWDSSIWALEDNKLPVLRGFPGQSGDGGIYLTTRDIRYAELAAVPAFTYNGHQQLPSLNVTFDGKGLTENTDYTVAITSTDGNGTSAGTNAGTVTLTLTGIGNYCGAKEVTYTIGKMIITVTPAAGQSKKYGETDPVLTYMSAPALLGDDEFTGALSREQGENVGTYAISLGTLSAGNNYALFLSTPAVSFSIRRAKVLSIDTTVGNVTMTAYEARGASNSEEVVALTNLPASVSVTTDGGPAVLPIEWTASIAYDSRGADYAVTGTLTGNGNIDANGVTKSMTISVLPVMAENPVFSDIPVFKSGDYSASAYELGETVLPIYGSITVEGVSVDYAIEWNGGETLDRTTVGSEKIFTGTISYIDPPPWLTLPGDLSVSRRVTVTDKIQVTIDGVSAPDKTYDDTAYVPEGAVTCSHGYPANQLEWMYESTDGAGYSSGMAPTDAGEYRLTISVPDSDAVYEGSEVLTFAIKKRQITLTADNKTMVKGESLPRLTYTVGNLPDGKTIEDALLSEPELACPEFDGSTPGSYAIAITGGTVTDNYDIAARTDGILTVLERTYTVTFDLNGGIRTGGGELTQTVAEGSAATAPEVYRTGHTFIGWDTAFDNVMSDLTATANWRYNDDNPGGGDDNPGGGDDNPGDGGGSSGENSGGIDIQPEMTPDQPVIAGIRVTPSEDGSGHVTVTVSQQSVADAIELARSEAAEQGKTDNGIGVAFNIDLPDTAEDIKLVLPRDALQRLVTAGVKRLEINGVIIVLEFDLEALGEIQKWSEGDVTVTIKPVRDFSGEAGSLIGARPAYDVTVSCVRDGQTVDITSLGNGTATFSLQYTPGNGEAAGYLFVVYVDDEGNANRVPGSAYDANSGSVVFSTGHFSVYGVGYTDPAEKYSDIENHWAGESIGYVAGRELFNGTAETKFSPDTAMSRGMLVTVLGRLAGDDVSAYETCSFSDVEAGKYYLPYVEWAYRNGIVKGVGNGRFDPERAVTREEIALILQNYTEAGGYPLPVIREAAAYADASGIGSIYEAAVTAMQQAGIMTGGDGNRFYPKAGATRAEVAAMLHRYIRLTIDPATARGWAKNDAGQYLYYRDGKALTGRQTIDGMTYFFNADGVLQTGWVKDGADWRFYSGNRALTGWQDIEGETGRKRYYFEMNGIMAAGKWLQIDGEWYYFNANGSLAVNTVIDGREVDENGIRK